MALRIYYECISKDEINHNYNWNRFPYTSIELQSTDIEIYFILQCYAHKSKVNNATRKIIK